MTVLLPACPVLVADPDVAELLADLEAAGIRTSVVLAPLYVDGCGACEHRAPGDIDAGRTFEVVAAVLHHSGGFADCTTPVCALCLWDETRWWVRRGRTVTVTAYGVPA